MSAAAMPTVLALGLCGGVQNANAGAFLWISAPTWTYSAAAAASPAGTAYFWAFSVGAGTYSWAYAYSHDGILGTADAFAEAATGLGGLGAVDVAGAFADPFASVGIDLSLSDASNTGNYPTSDPASDPFSSGFTVSSTGITFSSQYSSELNGIDAIQAFTYTGGTDLSTLENEVCGAACTEPAGPTNSSTGDVTSIGALTSDLGLIPLDGLITDPSSLSGITFTENTAGLNTANVILVGEGDAAVPEPASMGLFGSGLIGLALTLRRRLRK